MMGTDFLNELNENQKSAVIHYKGPSLIVAGAGSGKTRVLTYRIAYLLSLGIPAHSVLALTFTNKAANEMKERVGQLVGSDTAGKLWMGTFHGVFSQILRKENEHTGYPRNYTIYDAQDSRNVIKQIIRDLQLDDQLYKPNDIQHRISQAKNNLISAPSYLANSQIAAQDNVTKRPRTGEIYAMYSSRCLKAGAMDFDDLLLNTNVLFRDHPEILDKYQQKFKFILVDEYQDTNYAQYLIVKKLSQIHHNVCVVGDDAQSIYSFRGAKIENILNFKNDYPDYELFKLERNYRSTRTIVNAANSLIAHNVSQIQKNVFSENQTGDLIRVIHNQTDQEEGFSVAGKILDIKHEKQKSFGEIAVLYRTNAQSRIFEESFRKRNIPYKIVGGASFYQRKEIKDMIAYLRLVINPHDDEAFRRVINYPARGIGDTTLGHLIAAGNAQDLSLWQVASDIDNKVPEMKGPARLKVQGFIRLISGFSEQATSMTAADLGHELAQATGILADLRSEHTPENVNRLDNLEELLNGMRDFSEDKSNESVLLSDYLETISLLTDADQDKGDEKDKVRLMTIHASKGLEFNTVFIVGLEEMLFPSQMNFSSIQELEEERRLFYVAMTRAMETVFLSYAETRYKWGTPTQCTPSRFLSEIDRAYLEVPDETEPEEKTLLRPERNPVKIRETGHGRLIPMSQAIQVNKPIAAQTGSFVPDSPDSVKEGLTIEHERFGLGKVLHVEGRFPDTKATVEFEQCGRKILLLKFAKIRIIS
ncbi:MAG: 3'-5' exonuclease [Bacteroidales bacterium]|nr:3'-5' exonuclease [Bacteroidales bacterium]